VTIASARAFALVPEAARLRPISDDVLAVVHSPDEVPAHARKRAGDPEVSRG
jgi:hypothetical protein